MPLISKKSKVTLEEVRIKMSADLKQEILDYCAAFAIGDMSYFLEEAARFVLNKDKDWQDKKKHQASQSAFVTDECSLIS